MKIWFLKKPQAAVLPEGCEYAPSFNKADALWWPKGEVCSETDLPPIIICPNTSPDHIPASYTGQVVSLKNDNPKDTELYTFLFTITPTAEHTLGLIHAAHRCREAPPRMLSRMNLGIVGFGRIGCLVSEKATGIFNDHYIYDVRDDEDSYTLEEVLDNADILTLHGTKEPVLTKPLLDRWAKPDRILINTAQPWLVDNWYLMKLLEEKRIWAAGLDYDPGYDALNLVYSNHVGGSTQDAWAETEAFVLRRALELWTS
jgi:hypothetical protein